MTMNEIALFKGMRIQPYHKYLDFIFAGIVALLFLLLRIYYLYQGYLTKYHQFDVVKVFNYFKPHFYLY